MNREKRRTTWLLIDNGELICEESDYGCIMAAFRGRASPTARVIEGREEPVSAGPDSRWRKR